MCGSPRLCQRRERRLVGARFGRWREEKFGRARCLTLRYSLLLFVWVDPSAKHMNRVLTEGRSEPVKHRPYRHYRWSMGTLNGGSSCLVEDECRAVGFYEQALVCLLIEKLSTRVDDVRFIAKLQITVFFSNCGGLMYLAI